MGFPISTPVQCSDKLALPTQISPSKKHIQSVHEKKKAFKYYDYIYLPSSNKSTSMIEIKKTIPKYYKSTPNSMQCCLVNVPNDTPHCLHCVLCMLIVFD